MTSTFTAAPRSRSLALAGLLWCAACSPRIEPATAIVVSVKTDLAIGTELRELSYRVFRADADADLDAPVVELTAAAETLAHPFVILHQHDDALLLSVEGFAAAAQEPVVVARVRAQFEHGKSLALHVFLARVCLDALCETDGLSCFGEDYGEVEAGECAAVPGPFPLLTVKQPGDESAWAPMSAPAFELDAGLSAGDPLDASSSAVPRTAPFTTTLDGSR